MNKAFKRYKKSRWTDTPLSRKYRARLVLGSVFATQVVVACVTNIRYIKSATNASVFKSTEQFMIEKKAAITTAVIEAQEAIASYLGRVL